MTPLTIIATFVTLSESVAGLAAIYTSGTVQIMFANFAIIFPLGIASVFFMILWKKSYVLYPPKEFGEQVDVKHYVDAMRHQAIGNQELHGLLKTTITETLKSHEAQLAISNVLTGEGKQTTDALRVAAETLSAQAIDILHRAVITVDISAFEGAAISPSLVFPYDASQDAFSLLSAIYFQISYHVQPFTYGKSWVLQDKESGINILPRGIDWADNHALANSGASISRMGIRAGMTLLAVPFKLTSPNTKNCLHGHV